MSADTSDRQAASDPNAVQSAQRAVPHGLETYQSLQAAFAAPQPRRRYGLQTHNCMVEPRISVKTPTNSKVCDTPLPKYQHDTDNALAVDVGVLWRALDEDTPEHASFTTDKCKFNHEVDYLGDAALVRKLRSLPDFPALKAFLVDVLEPPPRPAKPQGGQATPNKRKWAGGDWPDRKRLYRGRGDLFEKLLTHDNLKGFGAAERLCLPTAAMKAEPFNWQPADATSKEPPTILITCAELGVVDVDATLGKRTTDGYRMGRGTQGLLSKLKAKPGDVMQLRVTKREGDTIFANLQIKRQQRAAATGGSTGGAPSAGGAAAGGSIGHNPSTGGAASAPPAARGATAASAPAESASPSRPVSDSDYGSDDEDDEVQIISEAQRLTSTGEQQALPPTTVLSTAAPGAPPGPPPGQPAQGGQPSPEAVAFAEGAVTAAQQTQQARHQQAQQARQARPQQEQWAQQARQRQQQARQQQEQQAQQAGQQQEQQAQQAWQQQEQQEQQAQQARQQQEQQAQQALQQQEQEEQQRQQQEQQQQERQAHQQQPNQQQQLSQQQQQAQGQQQTGGTNSGAHATGAGSFSATAKLAEFVLQRRLEQAVERLGLASDSEGRLPPLLRLAAVGLGGALLQEVRQRWAQLSDDCRELIADALASLKLHTDGQQQQLLPQLHLALDAAGETWHTGIAESGCGGAGTDGPGAAVVAKWQQRAAQSCEELSAAIAAASRPEVASQMLQRPLSLLALGYIGGAPLKEAVGGWAGYNRRQQEVLFEAVLVAVHQGAWQQLERRMQAALQLLPHLADQA